MSTHPPAYAQFVVDRVVRTLPTEARERYRREFMADLGSLPRARAVRYAVCIALSGRALRTSLGSPPRPLLCRTGLWHAWALRHTDDGSLYTECALCGHMPRGTVWPSTMGGGPQALQNPQF